MRMNFRYRLMQFMSGRYGPDELFFAVFAIELGKNPVCFNYSCFELSVFGYKDNNE